MEEKERKKIKPKYESTQSAGLSSLEKLSATVYTTQRVEIYNWSPQLNAGKRELIAFDGGLRGMGATNPGSWPKNGGHWVDSLR